MLSNHPRGGTAQGSGPDVSIGLNHAGGRDVVEEFLKRSWEHLLGRIEGPFWMRLVFQPLVASAIGIVAGVRDARAGRPAFGWSLIAGRTNRRALLKEGCREVARVFIAAIIIDVVYQIIVLHWFYPGQSLLVATVLAFVPYMLVRGPANRIASLWLSRLKKNRTLRAPSVPRKAA